MVAYNFHRNFGPDILSGRKQSTIRPKGKRKHATAGDELQLYVGMRTPNCSLLMRVPCAWSRAIEIHWLGFKAEGAFQHKCRQTTELAMVDGFDGWPQMRDWFAGHYPLPARDMVQIRWDFSAATFLAVEGQEGAT